jgi:hypothetical protein
MTRVVHTHTFVRTGLRTSGPYGDPEGEMQVFADRVAPGAAT